WDQDGGAACFLTETSAGGLGEVERMVQQLRSDPARFEQTFLGVLEVCPRDRLPDALWHAARHAARPPGGTRKNAVQQAFQRVRAADTFMSQEVARDALRAALEVIGLPSNREVVVALNLRMLRAG